MIPYADLITDNGTFTLPVPKGVAYNTVGRTGAADLDFYVSGGFGGRTATFGYVDPSDNFAPFRDSAKEPITTTFSTAVRVPVPPSGTLAVLVEGAGDAPALILTVKR